MKTAQEIFAELKEADNKKFWAIAQELYNANLKLEKHAKKAKALEDKGIDLNDKESLRMSVLEHLFAESSKGNAQASDKLGKWAGLGEQEQDIIIEIVNYNPKKVKGRKKSTTKT